MTPPDAPPKNEFIENITHHTADGTSVEPNSSSPPMWMKSKAGWMLMLHANVFVNAMQQSGPRGGDKVFSTNWAMPMAQRSFKNSTLTFRGMFSLDPATVTGRRYPLIFQTGETAFGRPIVDAQHPHDFFMELAAIYDHRIGGQSLFSVYAAPIGSPALGPVAFAHRSSAAENPLAALGHHQQDSTHIAADVFTVGFTHRMVRLEASGFHGREPDEGRWNIDQGSLDSWSTRITVNPTRNWSGQFSLGYLRSPESLHPDEDEHRQTASLAYHLPIENGSWSSALIWGRSQKGHHQNVFNSYLFESTLNLRRKHHLWTRIENADRSSELTLSPGALIPAGFEETPFARVQAYSFGYSQSFPLIPRFNSAFGGQVTAYATPDKLRAFYGRTPVGIVIFLRFRPASVR